MPWASCRETSASKDLTSPRCGRPSVTSTGRAFARSVGVGLGAASSGLDGLLEALTRALEESPAPEFEWGRLVEILGIDLVARLVGISATSVRKYRASTQST